VFTYLSADVFLVFCYVQDIINDAIAICIVLLWIYRKDDRY
jgi:hypothetical protein